MVVPQDHVRAIERLAQNMFICAPHASQVAALGALDSVDELERLREVYAANRTVLIEGLTAAGLTNFAPPDGAFYVYPSIAGCIGKTSAAGTEITNDEVFATALLEETGVAVVFGAAFGLSPNFRVSYATSDAALTEACTRIQTFCAGLT